MPPKGRVRDVPDSHPIFDRLVELFDTGEFAPDERPSVFRERYEEVQHDKYNTARFREAFKMIVHTYKHLFGLSTSLPFKCVFFSFLFYLTFPAPYLSP